ncbi:MAG TPA: DUF1778 domain-containing protein [Acidobacteriaceae bacterium]
MSDTAQIRKPLGVRATPQEHRILVAAAKRERRSLNSFVLQAALQAARRERDNIPVERTPETMEAAIQRAQELMRPHRQRGRSLSAELIAERRAEAARE